MDTQDLAFSPRTMKPFLCECGNAIPVLYWTLDEDKLILEGVCSACGEDEVNFFFEKSNFADKKEEKIKYTAPIVSSKKDADGKSADNVISLGAYRAGEVVRTRLQNHKNNSGENPR